MRISIGDIQNFASPTSLLSYCAANPGMEAGYAPAGQSPAQTLSCGQWPSLFPGTTVVSAAPACPSAEQQAGIVDPNDPCQSLAATTSSLTTILTGSAIGGIPNWVLIVGGLGFGYFLMKRGK